MTDGPSKQDSGGAGDAAWAALEAWLHTDAEGQAILAALAADPSAALPLLEERLRRVQLPPSLATYVQGGEIGYLVNIATVQGGLHLHLPSATSPPPTPAELPPDITEFTGREAQLAELRERVTKGKGSPIMISAVDGKPGVGKSALAIHLAHELAPGFPDGQLYVNLRGAEAAQADPASVLTQFLRSLSVRADRVPSNLEAAAALYRSRMAGKRAIVVLDNAANEAQVRPLLPAGATSAVLITSRAQLAALEGASPLTLEVLVEDEAIELLAKFVEGRVAADPAAAVMVVRWCGYLPLALRIVGAKLRGRPGWTVAYLAERLAKERTRLTELEVGDLTVRASFQLSYQSLPVLDARTFRLLGLLEGADASVGVVTALTNATPDEAEAALERLVDAQLLETPAPGRYRFHDLLRLFARELAEQEDTQEERQEAIERALGWYLRMSRLGSQRLQGVPPGSEEGVAVVATRVLALEWFEAERANLVAAAHQAASTGPADVSWQLADALFGFFDLRKYWDDWQIVTEIALETAKRTRNRPAQGMALSDLGVIHREQQHLDEAIQSYRQALAIYQELGDRRNESIVLMNLGNAYNDQGRTAEAIQAHEESVAVFEELGDELSKANVLTNLGRAYTNKGRLDKAIASCKQSIAIYRDLGNRRGEAASLRHLGDAYARQGRTDEAITSQQHSLSICRDIGDRRGEGIALGHLGNTYADQGRIDEAIACHEQSVAIFRELGDHVSEAVGLKNLNRIRHDNA
jgi:tetratricopeptide (TPR) repeat protein